VWGEDGEEAARQDGHRPVRQGVQVAREALAAARAAVRADRRTGANLARRGDPAAGQARRRAAPTASGAGPDDRDPQPLGRAIDRLLAERGWELDLAVGRVLGRWAAVVGPEVAAHCQPVSLADGVLSVSADSTAWATQLRLLAPDLLRRLAEEGGAATVTRVRVLPPVAPAWIRGRLSVRGRGPRDTYG
jgi:predicted nucleic acid-binding Zn ribbon protein